MRSSAALGTLPSAATGVLLTAGATAWVDGAWTEIAAAAPDDAVLWGILTTGGTFSNGEREVDIGIGTAGNEVAIATFRMGLWTSGGGSSRTYPLLVPISGIGGLRVSARSRDNGGLGVCNLTVLYLDNPNNQIVTDKFLTCSPNAANGVTVTPNATTWANSAWFELTSGESNPIAIAGIAPAANAFFSSFEFDIGIGAAAAETVITSVRGALGGTRAQLGWMQLNGIYTIPANTRVATRIRKEGTSVSTWKVSLLYYDNLTIQGNDKGAGKGSGNKGKGGGGLNIQFPLGASYINRNPGIDTSI